MDKNLNPVLMTHNSVFFLFLICQVVNNHMLDNCYVTHSPCFWRGKPEQSVVHAHSK